METRATAARRAATAATGAAVTAAAAPSSPTAAAAASAAASSAHPNVPAAATRSARGKRRRDGSSDVEESKRGRTAAAEAASAASLAASPLLRCMRGCRDIQFQLMQLLELNELAALDASCFQWREWLLHPPLVDGLDFDVDLSLLPSMLPCGWARQLVTSTSDMPPEPKECPPEPHSAAAKRKARMACDRLLVRVLPRFSRLQYLELQLCHSVVSEGTLRQCFTALAATLKQLDVWPYGADQGALVNRVLQHAPQLTRLDMLWVTADSGWMGVDFSPLAQLPALSRFTCGMRDRPTQAQVASLVQCRGLTDLGCGSWSPDAIPGSEAERLQIEQGIAALVRSRQPSAAGAEPPCVPLRELELHETDLSATVWEHVSQLTTLEAFWSRSWRSDITQAQWARLAHFQRLTDLKIWPHPDDSDSPLLVEHFLSHALLCGHLENIWLGPGLRLSRAQLQSIARQLTRLDSLSFSGVWLEDVAPLVDATRLCYLRLEYCDGPRPAGDPPVQFRALLPPLKRLRHLTILDRCRITAEQAAPLNAALRARTPSLATANFAQNLLSPLPALGPSARQ